MERVAGTIEFHISNKENNVAELVILDMGHRDPEINVNISLRKGYNYQKIRKLFEKNPIWKNTTLIPVFDTSLEESKLMEFAFENVDCTPKYFLTIVQEFQDKILPILKEIEPLTRMKNCPTCGHSSDVK